MKHVDRLISLPVMGQLNVYLNKEQIGNNEVYI